MYYGGFSWPAIGVACAQLQAQTKSDLDLVEHHKCITEDSSWPGQENSPTTKSVG